jgi:hypothetical protein
VKDWDIPIYESSRHHKIQSFHCRNIHSNPHIRKCCTYKTQNTPFGRSSANTCVISAMNIISTDSPKMYHQKQYIAYLDYIVQICCLLSFKILMHTATAVISSKSEKGFSNYIPTSQAPLQSGTGHIR